MPLAIPLAALGRFHDALPLFLRPVQFRVAETLEEFRAAAHLAYDESVARNYLQPASPQLKLTLHQALPQTTTLIAKHRTAGVIGTVTLIEDSPLGLPMDDGYKAELDHMRRGGLRLAEAALLTVDQRVFGPGVCAMFHTKKLLLILRLLQVMYEYTRSCTRVQELVACFNPRHHVLFEYLQMEHLGGLKAYAGANGSPTVARHVTIADMAQKAASHPAHRLFYGRVSQRRFAKNSSCQRSSCGCSSCWIPRCSLRPARRSWRTSAAAIPPIISPRSTKASRLRHGALPRSGTAADLN